MGSLRKLRRGQGPLDMSRTRVKGGLTSQPYLYRFLETALGKPVDSREAAETQANFFRLLRETYKPTISLDELRVIWDRIASSGWNRTIPRSLSIKDICLIRDNGCIKPNDAVASLASGTAAVEAFIAKNFVPNGHVTCVDISSRMSAFAEQTKRLANAGNMSILTASATATGLPSASQDKVISIRPTIYDTVHWQPFVREARRIIKETPDSKFILLFEVVKPENAGRILKSLEENGFKPERQIVEGKMLGHEVIMVIAKPVH